MLDRPLHRINDRRLPARFVGRRSSVVQQPVLRFSRRAARHLGRLQNRSIAVKLLPESEHEHRVAGGDCNVLPAIREIAHRAIRDLSAKLRFPQKLSIACIQRIEVAFAAAAEQNIR